MKQIPDEAVKKEKKSASFFSSTFDSEAKREEEAFKEEDYGDGVPKVMNDAVKRFIACVSWISIIALIFLGLIFACMITHYTKYIVADEDKLTSFLSTAYHVFSGGAIVFFGQLLMSLLKKK
jgi:hypothetical protein